MPFIETGRQVSFLPSVTATTTATTSTQVVLGQFAGGLMTIISGAPTAISLEFWIVPDDGLSVPVQIYTTAGAAVTVSVVNNKAYPLPDEVFAAKIITFRVGSGGPVVFTLSTKT